jgi:methylated-DNA-protein-cysteine methyltransferase-like protein
MKKTVSSGFYQQVYKIVAQIPEGKVLSYGQIAWMIGMPQAAQAVGWALRVCPQELPWQRVVRQDGSISGGLKPDVRKLCLEAEGVAFTPDGRVDMAKCCWQPQHED